MKRAAIEQDNDFIAEALPAFISEAHEQIEMLEQLLQLEDAPEDRELLDALFRCAHTVKGSAGIFGLDAVVAFAHHVETLLHQLRGGHFLLTPALSTLLLQCNDQIRVLVDAARDGSGDAGESEPVRLALIERLQAAGAPVPVLAEPEPPAETLSAPAPGGLGARAWHLSVHFGPDTCRNGMDPLAIVSYLGGMGSIPRIVCDVGAVPPLETIDPESCHLGFELQLLTPARRDEVEAAFSFVRDDCTLHILEPEAHLKDFAALIEDMPDNPRLGDILVSVGAITHGQLLQALNLQQAAVASEGVAPPLGRILQATSGLSQQVISAALNKQGKQRVAAAGSAAAPSASDDNRFIRVQADRLDEVINLLGELVIAGAGASLLAR